jgi:mRNA interferase MazF
MAFMFTKDFDGWAELKPRIHNQDKKLVFKERDIWWCSIGCNVGDEVDGKNNQFNRPVLIIKKFNHNIFYGLPMTTKIKNNPYYVQVTFQRKTVCALSSHMRLLDKKRLSTRLG